MRSALALPAIDPCKRSGFGVSLERLAHHHELETWRAPPGWPGSRVSGPRLYDRTATERMARAGDTARRRDHGDGRARFSYKL